MVFEFLKDCEIILISTEEQKTILKKIVLLLKSFFS